MSNQNKLFKFLQKLRKSLAKKDTKNSDLDYKANGILEAIGTKSNIITLDACYSRIRLTVKDASIINQVKLKQLGASKIIKLEYNNYQIVVGAIADSLVQHIKAIIKKA